MINIYVPALGADSLADLIPGSGIVGTPMLDGKVLVYFEGNKYRAQNIRTWADRVKHAAGRMATNYPTIAMRMVPIQQVQPIGRVRFSSLGMETILDIADLDRLRWWLGQDADLEAETVMTR